MSDLLAILPIFPAMFVGSSVADRSGSTRRGWFFGILTWFVVGVMIWPLVLSERRKECAIYHGYDYEACMDRDDY